MSSRISIPFVLLALFLAFGCTDDAPSAKGEPATRQSAVDVASELSEPADAPQSSPSPDAVELKFRYVPGKRYVTKTSMDMTTALTIAGESMEQKVNATTTVSLDCRATPDTGGKEVVLRYDDFTMKASGVGPTVEMSTSGTTADGGVDPMANMLKPILDAEITIVLDESDAIVEFRGLEALQRQFGGDPALSQIVGQVFDEGQLEQLTNVWIKQSLPTKPVGAGDSWPVQIEMPMAGMGTLSLDGTYRLEGFESVDGVRCAIIGVESGIALDASDAGATPMVPGMSIEDGRQTGKIWWDYELGFMRRSELVQAMTMSMNDPMTGQPTTLPMTMKVDSHVAVE